MTVTFTKISITLTFLLGTFFSSRDALCVIGEDRDLIPNNLGNNYRPPAYENPPGYFPADFEPDSSESGLTQGTPSRANAEPAQAIDPHHQVQVPYAPHLALSSKHEQDPSIQREQRGRDLWNHTPPPAYDEQMFMFGIGIDAAPAPGGANPSSAPAPSGNDLSIGTPPNATINAPRYAFNAQTDRPAHNTNARSRAKPLPPPLHSSDHITSSPVLSLLSSSSSFGSQDFSHFILQKDRDESPNGKMSSEQSKPTRFQRHFSDSTPSATKHPISPSLSRTLFPHYHSHSSLHSSGSLSQSSRRSESPFDVLGSNLSHLSGLSQPDRDWLLKD